MVETFIQSVRFDDRGLIPAIVQDASTNEVIGLCYMDGTSLAKTLQTGAPEFHTAAEFARRASRLIDVRLNADGASLTVMVEPGERSPVPSASLLEARIGPLAPVPSEVSLVDVASMEFGLAINNLYALIARREEERPEGSYTTYLFNSGLDKILKKIAEESGEVIIAAKNKAPREIVSELADLFYHLLVLMVERGVKLAEVREELGRRAKPQGKNETLRPGE